MDEINVGGGDESLRSSPFCMYVCLTYSIVKPLLPIIRDPFNLSDPALRNEWLFVRL